MLRKDVEFYFKAVEGTGTTLRVMEYLKIKYGFNGRASDSDREALAPNYAEFLEQVEAYGKERAYDECRENGELYFKETENED